MATISPTISESVAMTAVRAFILSVIACEVVQTGDNSVAQPSGGYIALTSLFANRLATNKHSYTDTGVNSGGSQNIAQSVDHAIQIDCYGDSAANWALTIATLFRDQYAVTAMAGYSVCPLYCDDQRQDIFQDPADGTLTRRWYLTAHVQYHPVVSVAQDFFDTATVTQTDAADKTTP